MSLKVLHLVFEAAHVQDRSEFTLLLALADEADDDGRAFPGRKRLARKSRLSERATNDVTQRLIDRCALAVIERGGPSEYGRPNLYLIDLDWLRDGPSEDSPEGCEEGVDNSTHPAAIAGCDPAAVAGVQPLHPADDDQDPAAIAGKLQSFAPNPLHTTTSLEGSKYRAREKGSGVDNLVALLTGRGIRETKAEELADRYPERVAALVERYDAERAAGEYRTPGWLVKAIEEDWRPATAAGVKLLDYQQAADYHAQFGGPTGPPWHEVLEAVDVDGRTMWRALR